MRVKKVKFIAECDGPSDFRSPDVFVVIGERTPGDEEIDCIGCAADLGLLVAAILGGGCVCKQQICHYCHNHDAVRNVVKAFNVLACSRCAESIELPSKSRSPSNTLHKIECIELCSEPEEE